MDKATTVTAIRVTGLRLRADREQDLERLLAETLAIDPVKIKNVRMVRKAVDARQDRVDFVYTVRAEIVADGLTLKQLTETKQVSFETQTPLPRPSPVTLKKRPVVVGCGPAGLFAALALAERGAPPIVFERGERMADRAQTVERFWRDGALNPESNMLFGEGGAGTFSDGKLTTRIKSPLKQQVLETLVDAGARADIFYPAKPHLGTDNLQRIVQNLVDQLAGRGVEFRFNTKAEDIRIEQNAVKALVARKETIETDTLFLATGHSARDIYHLLARKGVWLDPKGFAAGVRIEHPQLFINEAMLGKWKTCKDLVPADYALSFQDRQTSRGVYTFCMCPGGYVVGCTSRRGELCTNGMSLYDRGAAFANAAVVVSIAPDDLPGKDLLRGIEFQQGIETKVFEAGGGNFFAPVQRAQDFIQDTWSDLPATIPCSYRPGITGSNIGLLLPEFVSAPLKRALIHFDKKFPGFIREGLLIGAETRTSSPVRIRRDSATFHSVNVNGLIPIGEGSGYAGGIMSSAVDGLRAAHGFDK